MDAEQMKAGLAFHGWMMMTRAVLYIACTILLSTLTAHSAEADTACRYLQAADIARRYGPEIVSVNGDADSCDYEDRNGNILYTLNVKIIKLGDWFEMTAHEPGYFLTISYEERKFVEAYGDMTWFLSSVKREFWAVCGPFPKHDTAVRLFTVSSIPDREMMPNWSDVLLSISLIALKRYDAEQRGSEKCIDPR